MSLRGYLILMSGGSIVSWLSWLSVIFYINPQESGSLGFLFFYASLFLALTGTLALLGLVLRVHLFKKEIILRQVVHSFRQAIFFSFLIIALFYLQSKNLLRWWNLVLLILALTLLEFFIISYRRR